MEENTSLQNSTPQFTSMCAANHNMPSHKSTLSEPREKLVLKKFLMITKNMWDWVQLVRIRALWLFGLQLHPEQTLKIGLCKQMH